MSLPKLHIAVLLGGWSSERPVSLMSGEGVAKALESRGHKVTRIDMGRDVAIKLAETKPDVVFNALHGAPGEDGTVQGMMDLMGLTYTHSGMATSVIAIDKELTKQALVPHGIPMPGGRIVETAELYQRDDDKRSTAERRLQAEWLAEAGVDRALAKLSYDPDYKGETWEIPVDELGLPAVKDTEKGPAAVVKIEVEPAKGQDGGRILRVRADYPPDPPRRVRVSREVIAPKSS